MIHSRSINLIFGTALLALSGAASAEDPMSITQVPDAPKAAILKAANGSVFNKVEKETENGRVVYAAEWKDAAGSVFEIKVATDGSVLEKEGDDRDGDLYSPVIDPKNFVHVIDNPFMPLTPGTVFIYEGKTEKGNEHNEVSVLSETKTILGITCVVVKDIAKVDGVLEEETLDWYAQDKQGNVWYFGEDTKEYDGKGAVRSTKGTWEAGVKKARPGIVMEAQPKVGDAYRQEYSKGEAEDRAVVLSLSETATVPVGSFKEILMTNEWTSLDPTPVYEHKYYARGIGFIMTNYLQGGYELKLVEMRDP